MSTYNSSEAKEAIICAANNLIDLTPDNENTSLIILQPLPTLPLLNDMIVSSGRESIDNNPFDHAQKLADRFDDPFEIVHKNSSQTAPIIRVETGNLIGIEEPAKGEQKKFKKDFDQSPILLTGCDESIFLDNFSSLSRLNGTTYSLSSIGSDNTVDNASKSAIQTCISSSNHSDYPSSDTLSSIKNAGPVNGSTLNCGFLGTSTIDGMSPILYETLKTSPLNNVTKWQPVANRLQRIHSDPDKIKNEIVSTTKHSMSMDGSTCMDRRNQLLKLSLTNSSQFLNSPKNRLQNDTLIDSFEDINTTNPIWIDSESELDQDIEEMQMSCLKTSSDAVETDLEEKLDRQQLIDKFEQHKTRQNESKIQKENSLTPPNIKCETTSPGHKIDVHTIQETENLPTLLQKLKIAIDQIELSDSNKKTAHVLLDNLNSVCIQEMSVPTPTAIIRQDTFDLEQATEYMVSTSPPTPSLPMHTDQGIEGIVEQLKHLVANQQGNVLQSNLHGAVSTTDSCTTSSQATTYIVVMNSPSISKTTTEDLNDTSPTYLKTRSKRSLSLHLPTKPSAATRAIKAKAEMRQRTNTMHTPVRSGDRRSSFSSNDKIAKPSTPICQQPIRKSILKNDSSFVQPTQLHTTKTNKLKLRVNCETNRSNHTGPMKAFVPLKKLAVSSSTIESPVENGINNRITTSTPLATYNNVPSACSTPVIKVTCEADNTPPPITPQKIQKTGVPTSVQRRTISAAATGAPSAGRNRLSYMGSATPNPKRLSIAANVSRRRSLSEYKVQTVIEAVTAETETKEGRGTLHKLNGTKSVSYYKHFSFSLVHSLQIVYFL